ncbi:hypothetical protein ILUMI_17833 [Ignelater luminosus]|uniref:Integrase catalytic domain-containing protein n=1 Tax=Ignelater luminosus TaxID=2038154 RepID=A0A8K0CJ56_IGNLU|nr:hypothetical protein ILUMI_17833 [Ignelater luminosus]
MIREVAGDCRREELCNMPDEDIPNTAIGLMLNTQYSHQIAFDRLKSSLVNSGVLSYFDPKSHVVLSVDSSSQGLGAVILQNNKPIVYSSRALTKSEQAYCSIEYEPVEKAFYTLNEEVICQVNALIENLPIADRILDKIKTSINACKSIYAHGIPVVVLTDAGTQFSSEKFKDFASNYGFTHITASAKWSQSNGQNESAVKIVKNIFKKCQLTRDDPWLGWMEYRNTPKEHMPSPAQLLYSRNLRTRIPVRSEDLKPKVYRLPEKFVRHQDTVKKYYDKRTRPLQSLREGQNIRFQKHQSGHWYAGKFKGKGPQSRSYQVRDHNGSLFTRDRVMINPSPRQSSPTLATLPTNSTLEFPQPVQIHQQMEGSTLQETVEEKAVKNLDNKIKRSGRVVRNPKKLFDD